MMDMFVRPKVVNCKRDIVLGGSGQGGHMICLVIVSQMSPPL